MTRVASALEAPHPHRRGAWHRAWGFVRGSGIITMLLLATLVGVMAVAQYAQYDPAMDTRTSVNFRSHPIAITLHAVGASCAPLLGLVQWSRRVRRRWPRLHRWLGRVYLVAGVVVGGSAALWLSFYAFGGPVARLGMGVGAIIWIAVSGRAFFAIRDGDTNAHRRWMMRSVALALGGVTLRLYLPLLALADVPFRTAYLIVAWMAWAPNLLVAEWVVWHERRRS